jgi:hypothetical protein
MMNMRFLKIVAAATLVAGTGLVGTTASAATATACADGSPDATDRVTDGSGGTFMCEFGTGFVNYPTNVYDDVFFGGGFTEIERDGSAPNASGSLTGVGGNLAGEFSIAASLLNTYSSFVLVFKSAQEDNTAPSEVVAYNVGTQLTGDYLSPFAKTKGDSCDVDPTYTDCAREISHVALLGKIAAVPLPASGLLLLSVLGAGAFVGRRKKAA